MNRKLVLVILVAIVCVACADKKKEVSSGEPTGGTPAQAPAAQEQPTGPRGPEGPFTQMAGFKPMMEWTQARAVGGALGLAEGYADSGGRARMAGSNIAAPEFGVVFQKFEVRGYLTRQFGTPTQVAAVIGFFASEADALALKSVLQAKLGAFDKGWYQASKPSLGYLWEVKEGSTRASVHLRKMRGETSWHLDIES